MEANPKLRTIYDVLNDINDLIQEDTEKNTKIKSLIGEAVIMCNKICAKLLEYDKQALDNFWEKDSKKG